ncbi:SulP family inorganic anion transporter [Nitrosospira sp. NpAV]|uniref:SulP family inorganic anion transporter n=1 Tax=Nitrosospira sp. NpAV TaxID=58133 RepID=UPI00059F1DAD|nr:SulP family inorganic anion transporter [Nitrosospira sp. NpAV]KIO48167.1 sulfate transporter [Nitrosospira sp. NpAV]
MSSSHREPPTPSHDQDLAAKTERVASPADPSASAAFQAKYVARDVQAGIITGAMAIPLTVGIALMSEYPIKVALATVAFACFIGWINAFIRPGNYIGAPGVAAGLAPVLAMGVHSFGMENMAFVIFLTAFMQGLIWKFDWQKYILLAVPNYLVEGLLAGVGLKIALKFLTFTYELPINQESADVFWNGARIQIALISLAGFAMFVYLFSKFKDTKPAIPYFLLIGASIVLAQFVPMSMLHVDDVELHIDLPIPHFDSALTWMYVIGFAAMLAVIDVIEQVMSNAAIEKIDPLRRKCNTNNSLLAIWIANMGSSFFGGMTNLDGLAKSTTNRLAGAMTKFSVLVIGVVVAFFVMNAQYLEYLPKFSLAAIMIFSGWKMIMGLWHVAGHGQYAMILATLCGLLVYKVGIFEGLLIAMAVHGLINYIVLNQADKIPSKTILKKYLQKFSSGGGGPD